MVNRNCQLIMPRDLNLDSLTRFLGQAEIDIADGMAQESGLDGHQNGTQLTGRTLDFLRAFVRHVIETRNDGLEEIGQA